MAKEHSTRLRDIAFSNGTAKKALLTACVVDTILTAINHGDDIVAGQFPPPLKVFLTYCVPFCVTTWGSYLGKKNQIIKQKEIASLCGEL
ncbi:nitrate/nitrite transporter NrtS [Paracoccaceae bacterium]|nr:nitrate/nitrite transporter NrtS [Paracoccaceae bacterium]